MLYSDQGSSKGQALDTLLLTLLPVKSVRIGYIPSASDISRRYFQRVKKHYASLGISEVEYFDLGIEFAMQPGSEPLSRLLSSDAIHLSGGDPAEFLGLIQQRNFAGVLRKYVAAGGILIGISAGAMLMCQDILMCKHFNELKLNLKSLKALGLVNFEFYPHFDGSARLVKKLCEYSLISKKKIYACDDSEGLYISGDKLKCLGEVAVFEGGKWSDI